MKKFSTIVFLCILMLSFSPALSANAESSVSTLKISDTQNSIIPAAEYTEWYYRINEDGVFQKRLWSYTYQKWLTDWIDVE